MPCKLLIIAAPVALLASVAFAEQGEVPGPFVLPPSDTIQPGPESLIR